MPRIVPGQLRGRSLCAAASQLGSPAACTLSTSPSSSACLRLPRKCGILGGSRLLSRTTPRRLQCAPSVELPPSTWSNHRACDSLDPGLTLNKQLANRGAWSWSAKEARLAAFALAPAEQCRRRGERCYEAEHQQTPSLAWMAAHHCLRAAVASTPRPSQAISDDILSSRCIKNTLALKGGHAALAPLALTGGGAPATPARARARAPQPPYRAPHPDRYAQ